MRTYILALGLGCILSIGLFAQEKTPEKQADPEKMVEQRLERLTKELSLTADQQEEMRQLLEEQAQNRAKDRDNLRAERKKVIKEMEQILDPDQMKTLKKLWKEYRGKRRARGGAKPESSEPGR